MAARVGLLEEAPGVRSSRRLILLMTTIVVLAWAMMVAALTWRTFTAIMAGPVEDVATLQALNMTLIGTVPVLIGSIFVTMQWMKYIEKGGKNPPPVLGGGPPG